jgi:hypothetical protein
VLRVHLLCGISDDQAATDDGAVKAIWRAESVFWRRMGLANMTRRAVVLAVAPQTRELLHLP